MKYAHIYRRVTRNFVRSGVILQGRSPGPLSSVILQGYCLGSSSRVIIQGYPHGSFSRVIFQGFPSGSFSRVVLQGYHPGLSSRIILQGTVEGGRRKDSRKSSTDNIKLLPHLSAFLRTERGGCL